MGIVQKCLFFFNSISVGRWIFREDLDQNTFREDQVRCVSQVLVARLGNVFTIGTGRLWAVSVGIYLCG
jgi:hypothetical protein